MLGRWTFVWSNGVGLQIILIIEKKALEVLTNAKPLDHTKLYYWNTDFNNNCFYNYCKPVIICTENINKL